MLQRYDNPAQAANASSMKMNDNHTAIVVDAFADANASNHLEPTAFELLVWAAPIIIYLLVFVVGLCGNVVVIAVMLKNSKTEVTDIYILNLAIADLMFIIGLPILDATLYTGEWVFGKFMCKLYMASQSLNQFASSLLLVVMAFDRFIAVCHPIYATTFRQVGRAKLICLAIWILCLILHAPILVFSRTDANLQYSCNIYWPDCANFNFELIFLSYSMVIGFVMPVIVIGGSYYCILRKLRIAATGSMVSSKRSRRESNNRRVEKLVVAIICTYTFCWLPYWVSQVHVIYEKKNQATSDQAGFAMFAAIFCYLNSALNPILYAFLGDKFKHRCELVYATMCAFLCRWCGCCKCCTRCQPEPPTNRRESKHQTSMAQTNVSMANPTDAHSLKLVASNSSQRAPDEAQPSSSAYEHLGGNRLEQQALIHSHGEGANGAPRQAKSGQMHVKYSSELAHNV